MRLTRTWTFTMALLCMAGGARSQSASTTGGPPLAHAKLMTCDGVPCIDVRVGDKHIRLAIDTGNVVSVLNVKAAQDANIALEPYPGPDGKPVNGVQKAQVTLAVGGSTLPEVKFIVADLSPAISAKAFANVDGTLSYVALKDRIVQLDYPGGEMSISELLSAPTSCPGSCGEISLLTFGKQGPPIVTATGFNVNGKPVSVQIDTMFTGALLIYPTSVEKLGLTAEAESRTVQHFAFTDGGVDMFQSTARQVGFGSKAIAESAPLYFAGPKVHLPDGMFDGTVGAALLSQHKVTFNFHDNTFWLE